MYKHNFSRLKHQAQELIQASKLKSNYHNRLVSQLIHEKYEEPLECDDPQFAQIVDKLRKTSMQILERVEKNHKKKQIKAGINGESALFVKEARFVYLLEEGSSEHENWFIGTEHCVIQSSMPLVSIGKSSKVAKNEETQELLLKDNLNQKQNTA